MRPQSNVIFRLFKYFYVCLIVRVSPDYLWLAFTILDRVGFSEEIDVVHTKEPVDVKDEELKAIFTQRRITRMLLVLDQ